MASVDDKLEIVPEQAIEVRETRSLFRLAPAADNDLSRASRQVAIVAADTEDEASPLRTTFSGATGEIRISLPARAWKRRRPTFSAT
jgi:hypothetical protein